MTLLLISNKTLFWRLSPRLKIEDISRFQVWVFLKIGIPQNFNIDGLEWKTLLKWISFGGKTHYFWKHPYIWVFPKIVVPKSSILIRFSIINYPFWGTPIFGNAHIHLSGVFKLQLLPYVSTKFGPLRINLELPTGGASCGKHTETSDLMGI